MSSVLSFQEKAGPQPSPLIGCSPAIDAARRRLARFARSPLPVLLVGPTGTGKELLAQHLHTLSGRAGELIDVNCGALPREMVESLLFGHRKGAFSGAIESTRGLIAQADRGTLFLDELSSLSLEGQAKLLRVLDTNDILPLGAPMKQHVDFRLVAAVQADVAARVERGDFRRDLFHRVAVLRIDLPGLAARREDVPLLALHFAQEHGCVLTNEAVALLQAQAWQGNVRELRAVINRAVVMGEARLIAADAVGEALDLDRVSSPESMPTGELLRVCRSHHGRAAPIAAALGVSRATLFRRLRASGISLASLRASRSLETP